MSPTEIRIRPIQDLHSPKGGLCSTMRRRNRGQGFKEAMAEVREGGMAMMNDGRSGASSAISGFVLFRLCQPKINSTMEFIFLIYSRTSHVTKIDVYFFNALRNGRCGSVWHMRYIFWSEISDRPTLLRNLNSSLYSLIL